MRITNSLPNDLKEFPVDHQTGINKPISQVKNVKHKKTTESLTTKATRLYHKPKQKL